MLIDFERTQNNPQASGKSVKGLVAMATVGLVAVLGSTLAANISLNSGSIEFGQGVSQATACDNSITITPRSVFNNVANGGQYNFASVAFSGVADACIGDTFTLNAYDASSATPLVLATSGANTFNVATFVVSSTLGNRSAGILASTTAWGSTADARGFEIGFSGTQATSGAVFKITLQSS